MSESLSFLPLPEMPLLPITSEATVRACRELPVSPETDVFVCSYPKSGTTWLQTLVCRLLAAHFGQELPDSWHLSHSAPFYEVDRYWNHPHPPHLPSTRTPADTALRRPCDQVEYRVFNTHLRPHQLPTPAKCLYVMRSPLDVLASFYYHLANMSQADGGYTAGPSQFIRDFLNGTILYGKWQDHMESWLSSPKVRQEEGRGSVLLLHYDEMKADLRGQATRVARFLGVPEENLDSVVNTAVKHCTFEAMKKEHWRYTPRSVDWKISDETGQPYQEFVRAGRLGDGESFLNTHGTEEMRQRWQQDKRVARERWIRAGVDERIVDKYLGES